MKIIETKRLLLKDLRGSDWQAVHEYASDPEVVKYMDWGPNTDNETKEFIQRAIASRQEKPRNVFTLAIVLKEKERLIGSCGIHISNLENREGWLGYCLNRKYWNKGYGTETSIGLVNFGFAKLNSHRIFATCDPENTASAHVLEKSGMKREGHLRQHKWSKGKWRDSYVYAILEEEWKQIQK
jgi:RimJ/RimL family protein N-acetyltransferase